MEGLGVDVTGSSSSSPKEDRIELKSSCRGIQLSECFLLHPTPACQKKKKTIKTRGQRPNESQKAVIKDVMKSVGEIASKIWPVVNYLTHFGEILTLTFDLDSTS